MQELSELLRVLGEAIEEEVVTELASDQVVWRCLPVTRPNGYRLLALLHCSHRLRLPYIPSIVEALGSLCLVRLDIFDRLAE